MDDFGWIIWVVLVVGGIVVKIFQSRDNPELKQRRQQLLERRRAAMQEIMEGRSVVDVVEVEEADDEDEPVRRRAPEIRIIEELPDRSKPVSTLASVDEWGKTNVEGLSLEKRLFSNRRLSTAAKMVLANEILQRPKSLRR